MAKSNGRTQRPQRTSRNSSKAKVETKAQSNDDVEVVEDPQTVQAEDPKDERLDGDLLDLDDSSDTSDVVADDTDATEKSTAATVAADKKSAAKTSVDKKADSKDADAAVKDDAETTDGEKGSDKSADLDADDVDDSDDAEDSKTATKSEKAAKATKDDKSNEDGKDSKSAKKSESSKTATKGSSAKGSSAKRTSRSGNPAKRPQGRKTASYTSQSGQQTIKPNPRWFLPVLIGLLIIGLIWLVTFYVSQGAFPVEAWGNWNILIGFAFFVAGLIMSTRWR